MKTQRRFLSLLVAIIMVFSLTISAEAADDLITSPAPAELPSFSIGGLDNNIWVSKYGNLYCDCSAAAFTEAGFAWGDIVTLKILDYELVLPVVPAYSYVDIGAGAITMGKSETGEPTGYLAFAINMGTFAEVYGIATKQTDADGNWYWTANEGITFPITVTFEMTEQGGYTDEYLLHELTRTNAREDYAELSDEEFANFRPVTTTGMGDGVLYRSSSPINPKLNRNTYADAAINAAGVKTIVNLADNISVAAEYEGFASTYYAAQNVVYLSMGADFQADDFKTGLAAALRHIATNEGPYLIHCTEGKDRAGFVTAILECYMGATYDEVVADYMRTYINYYGVEIGSEKYDTIAKSNIIKTLQQTFNIADPATADLQACAAAYLKSIGLTDTELAALTENLTEAAATVEQLTYTVAKGDSLWKIAKTVYGKGSMWKTIYDANTSVISDPNRIYVGQTLILPAA